MSLFSMRIGDEERRQAESFLAESDFRIAGSLMTDLDGTALDEMHGKVYIPPPVKRGVKRLLDAKKPVVLNTLRFPLSVIRTVGTEWYEIANQPVPAVCLNGSVLGYVVHDLAGSLDFKVIESSSMSPREIDTTMDGVMRLVEAGLSRMAVFYYPADWKRGEIIWSADATRVERLRQKFVSASEVYSSPQEEARQRMKESEPCMIFVLADVTHDDLMAYQHANKATYFTREGIDKISGARAMARRLGLDLDQCIGAGDTELDNFLSISGLAVHVRKRLGYLGVKDTVRIGNQFEFGDLLNVVADELEREKQSVA